MNVSDLAKGVAEATGSNEADAKKAITAVFDQIAAAAVKGEEVSIPGFGKRSRRRPISWYRQRAIAQGWWTVSSARSG